MQILMVSIYRMQFKFNFAYICGAFQYLPEQSPEGASVAGEVGEDHDARVEATQVVRALVEVRTGGQSRDLRKVLGRRVFGQVVIPLEIKELVQQGLAQLREERWEKN